MKFGKTFLVLIALLSALFITCDIGMGPGINTSVPSFDPPEDGTQPGDFIRGSDSIRMKLASPYAPDFIDSAFMTVDYFDINGDPQTAVVPGVKDLDSEQEDGNFLWDFKIDTDNPKDKDGNPLPPMGDGQITTAIISKDRDGNPSTTTPLVYTIKNAPPKLEMSMPRIAGIDFDSPNPGGSINRGMNLIAIATDLSGIAQGYPQIMIWPKFKDEHKIDLWVPGVDGTLDDDNAPASNARQWGTWRTMLDDSYNPLNTPNLPAVMAYWPSIKIVNEGGQWVLKSNPVFPVDYLEDSEYNFKIRVKDSFEDSKYNIYPYRIDNQLGPEVNGKPTAAEPDPTRYMTITIKSTDNPIINIISLPKYYNRTTTFIAEVEILTSPGMALETPQAIINQSNSVDFDNPSITKYPLTHVSGNRWNLEIPFNQMPTTLVSSENFMMHIKAVAGEGWSIANRNFIFDVQKPTVSILQPANLGIAASNAELTSTVKFTGTTEDDYRVVELYYALGRLEVDSSTLEKGGSPSVHTGWTDTGIGLTRESGYTIAKTTPQQGHNGIRANWANSLASWAWDFIDIAEVCTASPAADQNSPHARNAANTFNHYVYDGGEGSKNIWVLPIMFKTIDISGNVSYTEFLVKIDPDGDRPIIEITSHGLQQDVNFGEPGFDRNKVDIVGGNVRLGGLARDNEVVQDVMIRITAEADGAITANPNHLVRIPVFSEVHTPFSHPTLSYLDNFVSISSEEFTGKPDLDIGVGNVVGRGGSVASWFYNINRNGVLQPPPGNLRYVKVEFRAKDASMFAQDPLTEPKDDRVNEVITELILLFSGDIPLIQNVTIIPNTTTLTTSADEFVYDNAVLEKSLVKGDFVIRAEISAVAGVKNIKVRRNASGEGTGFVEWLEGAGSAAPTAQITPWRVASGDTIGGYREKYTLYIPIRSNLATGQGSISNGRYANSAGSYALDIQVFDNNSPSAYMAQENINLSIDNYAPLGSYTGNAYAVGNYSLRGDAWDTGSGVNVQGIDKVVVFLSKNDGTNSGFGTPVNFFTGANLTTGWSTLQTLSGRTQNTNGTIATAGTAYTVPYYPTETMLTDANGGFSQYGAVITDTTTAHTNAGITYTPNLSGNPIKNWSITFNSRNIQDGKYWVNFVVFDKAGNTAYFRESVYFANNGPKINHIHLGTDINRSGTVTETNPNEFKSYQLGDLLELDTNPRFRARNNRFAVRMQVTGGNGNKNYSVNYATRSGPTAIGGTNQLVVGNTYTIAQPGNFDWINYGALAEAGLYEGVTFVATKATTLPTAVTGDSHFGSTVYSYTINTASAPTAQTNTPNLTSNNLTFDSGHFGTAAGRIPDNANSVFLLRVYDTTISGGSANEQLAHIVPVTVNIENADGVAARLRASHFGQEFVLKEQAEGEAPRDPQNPDDWEEIPISETFYNRNIVMTNTAGTILKGINVSGNTRVVNPAAVNRTGYVQYRDANNTGGTANNADVSGRIIFTGQASDNVAIALITAEIVDFAATGTPSVYNGRQTGDTNSVTVNSVSGNITHTIGANEFVIANWVSANNRLESRRVITSMGDTLSTAWGLDFIDNHLSTDYGHFVTWEFAWDSSHVTSMARNNAAVIFRVYDFGTANSNNGIGTTGTEGLIGTGATAQLRRINFDVVPYIKEIVTPLSSAFRSNPSAFNRSARGWYPVREDSYIQIKGFNLNSGTPNVTVGSAINIVTAQPANYPLDDWQPNSKNRINARIDNDGTAGPGANAGANNSIVSGPLVVTVNGIQSFNNRNDDSAHYNKEPNNVNNNILNDDRNLYVWSTGYFSGINGINNTSPNVQVSRVYTPFFRMDNNANRYVSYGYYGGGGDGRVRVDRNGTVHQVGSNTQNRQINTTLGLGGSNGSWYTTGSNITASATTDGLTIYRSNAAGTGVTGGQQIIGTLGSDQDRFKISRIAVRPTTNPNTGNRTNANADRIFMSYFDATSANRELRVIYGNHGDTDLYAGTATQTFTSDRSQLVADDTQTHRGSMYSAAGILSNGLPVIAWYDRVNQTLVFSWGNATPTTTAHNNANSRVTTTTAQWQANATIIDSFRGAHVDMAVDQNDNVHLAYYDVGNGGLWYAFIPYNLGNGRPNVTNITPVRVDTYLSAGTKIMINVRGQGTLNVPYISYAHASFAETANSVRIAWRHDFTNPNTAPAGCDEQDRFTGAWEVMTVPAGGADSGGSVTPNITEFVCNGVPTANSGWNTAQSTTANQLRGYYVGGTAGTNNSIHRTVMVTYFTDRWYEGAVLKANLWTP